MRTPRTSPRSRTVLSSLALSASGVLMLVGLVGSAAAREPTISGVVTQAHSRWTDDGSRIVTEAVLATATGDVKVSQLGGTVDGLTMRTFPGMETLAPGMVVEVVARPSADLSARTSLVVDQLAVTGGFQFVRTGPTKGGKSLFWKSGCVQVTLDTTGTSALAAEQEATVVAQVIAQWNTRTASCSYMNVVEKPRAAVEVGRDFANVIKFRDAKWCRPAIKDDPERCYSSAAAGLTTVVYVDDPSNPRDGEIVDADVELNGVNFAISANGQSLSQVNCKSDLANTLTHEIGHLLGLEHTCLAGGDPPRVDDRGAQVPTCSSLPDTSPILNTTMYNFQSCGETKKANLSQDEVNALCSIYPLADDPGTCGSVDEPGAGCCNAQPNVPGALTLLLGTGLLLLLGRRRT